MIDKLEELKQKIFTTDEEVEIFLANTVKALLNNKIKEQTISPLILTFKEFIDVNLKRILNAIVDQLKQITDVDEKTLKLLAAYLINKDIKTNNIIYKTVAKYILDLIKTDHLALKHFVSDMREVYNTPKGKYKYPILYPFDRHKYASPIPVLKQILLKVETAKRQLNKLQEEYNRVKEIYEKSKLLISDIKLALKRIKESILPHLKKLHSEKEYNERALIFSSQKKRFEVLYMEAEEKMKTAEKKLKALEKNIEGFKEKNKDILNKEEELIEEIAKNLATQKRKI